MAKDNIKSLSVKIGADTSDFIKGLKSVDKQINTTVKEAEILQKGLEFEFDEKRFVQSQKQFQKALSDSEEKSAAIRKQLEFLEKSDRIDTESYQRLQIELAKTETNALKLKQQLKSIDDIKLENATKGIKDFGENVEKAGKKLLGVSAAAAGVLVGAGKLAKDAIKVGDDVATMSSQFDLSAKAIQQWQYIALQGDVPAEKLLKGANKIRDALGSQMTGEVNNATKVLDQLQIKMSDFGNQEDAFTGTILALSKIEDKTLQYNMAVDLFGEKMATDIIPLLDAGEESIAKWANEFEEVGYLTDAQVEKLAKFDEEMNKFNKQFEQAKLQLGIALLPVLEIFVDILSNYIIPLIEKLTAWFESLSPEMQKTIVIILGLISVLAPLLIIIGKVSVGISALIPLFVKLKAAGAGAALGIGALIGALALGLNLIIDWKQMSTVEKILKTLGLAALTAAAAVAVFHASWSVGLAIGAITAGIVAAVAAVNEARKKLIPESEEIKVNTSDFSMSGGSNSNYDFNKDFQVPNNGGSYGNIINDNSKTEINITLTPTGDLNYDVKELAELINRELINKKLAYR